MIALIVIIVILAVVAIMVALLYNGLVRRRNQVDNAWSQIDVQLKRDTTSSPTWSRPSRTT